MNSPLFSLFWIQFWQITLLIPVAILFVRYVLPKHPHLGYGLLLLVLVKTVFPPVWNSPTGFVWELIPWTASSAIEEDRQQPLHSTSTTGSTGTTGLHPETIGIPSPASAPGALIAPSADNVPVAGNVPVIGSFSPVGSVPTEGAPQSAIAPTSTGTALSPAGFPLSADGNSHAVANGKVVQTPAFAAAELPWRLILFLLWLAGVLTLLGFILGKRAQLLKFHRDTQIPASDELLESVELVSAELGLLYTPRVLVTLHPTVPFASGYFEQIIVLPAHLVEQTEFAELQLVLAHEMTHLRRGDTIIGFLQLLVQVVWWFHPLVYWLNREVRRIREECCDVDVVLQLKCPPASYARCLLNMLELHRRLRPATELIGLSPLEVTTKRIHNIMRTSPQPTRRWTSLASPVLLVCFTMIILPATARSAVAPKVILGELTPQDALRTPIVPALPDKKKSTPDNRPKKKAKPVPPARVEEAPPPVAEIVPQHPTAPPPAKVVPFAPLPFSDLPEKLSYNWERDQRRTYHVKVEAQYPTELRTHTGSPTFHVAAYAAGIPALDRLNPKFEKRLLSREGGEIPSLPQYESSEDFFLPRPYLARPSLGYPFSQEQDSQPVKGSNGDVDPASGHLPYLLGELKDWVYPELPVLPQLQSEMNGQREITLISSTLNSSTPFSSPAQEKLGGMIQVRTAIQTVTPEQITLSRTWTLSTTELANGEPRREISLSGQFKIDRSHSFPTQARYTGRLVEREPNLEYRIPLTIEIDFVE